MAVNFLHASAVLTILSFTSLHWWTASLLDKFRSDGLIDGGVVSSENVGVVLKLLWGSHATVALLAIFVVNVFFLVVLCLKTIFFVQLYPSEIRKMLERLFNYVIYKGAFLPLVMPPSVFHLGMWSSWLIILSSLKMFQTLAKDRLERLNSSPSVTYGTYVRVFSALIFVLVGDILWMTSCIITCGDAPTSIILLLFFEPLSIAFETMQAIIVHGFQFLEIWHHQALDNSNTGCLGPQSPPSKSAGASLWEWKSILIRNFGFILDTMTLLMALGHYLVIWWLHGMSFHLVDAVLFLNLRALVSAIIKKVKGFIKLRKALSSLDVALLDATFEELCDYNDDCAICREPMCRAKKLSCNHLFHLSCLRSWLDQGISEVYSCPTCRRPLFPSTSNQSNSQAEVAPADQHVTQATSGPNQPRSFGHAPLIDAPPNRHPNPTDGVWRGSGVDPTWAPHLSRPGVDGAGTSTPVSSVGLNRVQLMMRHLASVSETYAHGALEDTAWNFWPPQQRSGASFSSIPHAGYRNAPNLRLRSNAPVTQNMSDILAMAERVREVLPHIPDEHIIQDLQRTNNAATTVNNFLPT